MSSVAPVCASPPCQNPAKKSGLCGGHEQRRRRGADISTPLVDRRKAIWPECRVEGCVRKTESKTGKGSRLCPVHMNQERRGVTPGIYRQPGRYKVCQVPGCKNPFQSSKLCAAHSVRRRKYSMEPDEFIAFIQRPCAICGNREMRQASIDHDHSCCPGEQSCGKCVRGLLCSPCNLGLGAFRDDPARLQRAIQYLSG